MISIARAFSVLKYLVLLVVLLVALSVTWLRWESGLSRDDWFDDRQGRIESLSSEKSVTQFGQQSESVRLVSDSGLGVFFRIIREPTTGPPLPVLLILGGHRTGSDAIDLFGHVGNRAIVGIDYPYDGPEKVKGLLPIVKTIPLARQAFLDTTPAVSLVIDWLVQQPWVDTERVIVVGASLGVPFAATAAARDARITGVMLVHGAADNRLWLKTQVARRIDTKLLHDPLATLLHWLAYGPVLDTAKHIATISPRPVLIVAARDDERTPAGQAELLLEAAREPKRLVYTEGRHIQPNRKEIVAELWRIADEQLEFLTR